MNFCLKDVFKEKYIEKFSDIVDTLRHWKYSDLNTHEKSGGNNEKNIFRA